MLAHVHRIPFSLHALIAEAKRRARRRRIVLLIAVIAVLALGGGGGGAVYATHPFGWFRSSMTHLGPPPFHPRPYSTAELSSVSAGSRKAAWIVGSVAWRWNGTAWRSVPLPWSGVTLSAVAAVAPDDVWAVGSEAWCCAAYSRVGGGNPTTPVIEHWNGVEWSPVWTRGTAPYTVMRSISAAGPRNVWALGMVYERYGRPLLLHWNGHAWLKHPVPAASIAGIDDQVKVVAVGRSGVWLVPTGMGRNIEYWNGARWQAVPRPFGPRDVIADFSATGGTDAWAVGSDTSSRPLAAHWDGSAWTAIPAPEVPWRNYVRLDSVVAVRPNDVWAGGLGQHVETSGNTIRKAGLGALLVHWNGRRWSVTRGSLAHVHAISGLAAAADGSAWAIGSCATENVVLGWNGARWKMVPHPPDLRWSAHALASDRRGGPTFCGASVASRR